MYQVVFVLVLAVFNIAECKPSDDRIIGGKDAEPGQFPFLVQLWHVSARPIFNCGGSILNENWLITARHCIPLHPEETEIVSGSLKLEYGDRRHKIDKCVSNTEEKDTGLIKVRDKFVFDDKVAPIPLPNAIISDNSDAVVAGWGQTIAYKDKDRVLQYLPTKAFTQRSCKNLTQSDVSENEICAFTKFGEGACFGDSGGPLFSDNKIIGIVSRGIPCALGFADVYSSVYHNLDFINSHINQ